MLSNARMSAIIPVTNLERSRKFYEAVLELQVSKYDEDRASVIYESGGTYLTIYQRASASSGDHTVAGIEVVGDFDVVVDRLIERGVTFDTFDVPDMEMPWDERGVLVEGEMRSAWFKDPDGNIIGLAKGVFS